MLTRLSYCVCVSPNVCVVQCAGARRRESLLASLEKKAEPTGRSIFGASGDDALVSCDLIAALTDADMDIIDSYALRLCDTMGGDAEEAYAIALDAFVRGTILFYSWCFVQSTCCCSCHFISHSN